MVDGILFCIYWIQRTLKEKSSTGNATLPLLMRVIKAAEVKENQLNLFQVLVIDRSWESFFELFRGCWGTAGLRLPYLHCVLHHFCTIWELRKHSSELKPPLSAGLKSGILWASLKLEDSGLIYLFVCQEIGWYIGCHHFKAGSDSKLWVSFECDVKYRIPLAKELQLI